MSAMPPGEPGRASPRDRVQDLEAIIDSIVDYAIITVDLEGNVASWSRGAEALKKYTASEIIGMPVSLFYAEEDKASGPRLPATSSRSSSSRVQCSTSSSRSTCTTPAPSSTRG